MEKETGVEFKEALAKLILDIRSTRIMLVVFAILGTIVKIFFKVPISFWVVFFIFIWFSLYFFYEHLVKKTKTTKELYDAYFSYSIIDLLFLTILIHYLGGVEWIGAIFYILTLLLAGIILPKKKTIVLGFIASFFYLILISLEYFGALSHKPLFLLVPGLYRSFSYIGVQILVVVAVFYFVVTTTGDFSEMLKEKRRELAKEKEKTMKAYQEVQKSKTILEIKIKELERFQKLATGREFKMIELKKEIENLKEELKGREDN